MAADLRGTEAVSCRQLTGGSTATGDGTIAHAEMHLTGGTIMPRSPMPEWGMTSPRALDGVHQCIYITVEDPDAHYERAKAVGAEILMPPTDLDYGARNSCARDLEGHVWGFGTYVPRTGTQPEA